MNYEIKSEALSVCINSSGAEIQSIKSNLQQQEYMWQGDSAVWAGQAPILFPIVGALRNNSYSHDNKIYSLNKHGFARNSEFNCVQHSDNAVSMKLTSNSQTLKQYPWAFELCVSYQVTAQALKVSYQLHNRASSMMPFNIGSHPAFALDLKTSTHEEYFLQFSGKNELLQFHLDGDLLSPTPSVFNLNIGQIGLSKTLFDNDALVFKNTGSKTVSLWHKSKGEQIRVDCGDAPHLGIWAKPNSNFVCIEPWWGYADHNDSDGILINKPSVQRLETEKIFIGEMTIEIPSLAE